MGAVLALRAFDAADLHAVEPWFDDAETQRRLGDRSWPRRLLELVDPPDRMAFLALEDGAPVALADVECGADGRAAVALVVAPAARGRAAGPLVLRALAAARELAHARELYGAAEPGNLASERCMRRAGFAPAGVDRDGWAEFVLPLP